MILPKPSDMRSKISFSHRALVWLLGFGLLAASCGNNGCEETRESYLYAQLKATTGVSLTKLYAWGLGFETDSLMLSESSPSSLEFILRPDTTFTQIRMQCTVNDNGDLFQYDDTLSIRYEVFPYFIDMECGCSMFFTIQDVEVTRNLFNNIILKQAEITNNEAVNIILQY
ncbi:MAG: hypothetical protein J6U31_02310 [Bacteroidales bacterium]|nr:hypothetical protein [Bacteroidales bacterium]